MIVFVYRSGQFCHLHSEGVGLYIQMICLGFTHYASPGLYIYLEIYTEMAVASDFISSCHKPAQITRNH